ncbi:GTPase-associated system all-helical protein GASH [Serratia fonticola]|uniref:GTPase-associated system all-helical protein GASH n=1 Tax=Serratia fonticola TaxID=47917 RepID=UPI003985C076
MAKFTFADRYAEAGLKPSSETITARQEPVKRIVANIKESQILDLVSVHYGSSDVGLDWFRDEFAQEDASFSLVHNEREGQVLAALILAELIVSENAIAILAVSVGSIRGLRISPQSSWLLNDAEEALMRLSVVERVAENVSTKITPTIATKLDDEIIELGQTNSWPTLITILGKIRAEAQSSALTTAKQVARALTAFNHQAKLMREESQMLWWLISGYSKTFERSFAEFGPQQAALVGAMDLGTLTTQSQFGPISTPAMLERIIASAKKTKGQQARELVAAIDGFVIEDLKCLEVPTHLPAKLAPVTSAIELARTMGISRWHSQFQAVTGLEPSIQFDSISLAEQLYREYMLGKLL